MTKKTSNLVHALLNNELHKSEKDPSHRLVV